MSLRKHQIDFRNTIDGILSGSGVTKIICHVTPGGGKSSLPVIAGKLIKARKADSICWIVPRKELQSQGETAFMDSFFREMLGHDLLIRSSTNEINPCRGLNGFITTYNAIGIDQKRIAASEFDTRRYILILDECHHVEKESVWHKALYRLVRRASFLILMTGTLGRGNEKEIAFIQYDKKGKPILEDSETTRIISYSRKQALAERAILPMKFHFIDGQLSWEDEKGIRRDVESFRRATLKENSAALYTALNTDYAKQLLTKAVNHWSHHLKKNPFAKLLVVTDGFENAKKCVGMLKANGIPAEIATSHETPSAIKNIKAFKAGLPVLVTIAMAYEGMDVPAVTHLCCLTHIRSTEWIEQMLARAVRIDKKAGPYETQIAHIFAPKDKKFMAVVDRINAEQLAIADKNPESEKKEKEGFEDIPGIFDPDARRSDITPLFGQVVDKENPVVMPDIHRLQIEETPKEKELRLRKEISKHLNTFCALNRYEERSINSEIKTRFMKPRAMMTLSELTSLFNHIKEVYPVQIVRGSGKKPVEKKVMPFELPPEMVKKQGFTQMYFE